MTTSVTGRVLAGLHRGLFRGVVYLATLPLRAAVALLVRLGVARVAATVLFVGWAEPIVGLRSATWLVVIWWVHRLTRHKRAALYRHELVRRAERALERQASALAAAARMRQARPAPSSVPATRPLPALPPATTPADHVRVATPPQPAADQPPEQTVAALGRHTRQADGDTPTRPDGRHPR